MMGTAMVEGENYFRRWRQILHREEQLSLWLVVPPRVGDAFFGWRGSEPVETVTEGGGDSRGDGHLQTELPL